jgi:hypothetical protein
MADSLGARFFPRWSAVLRVGTALLFSLPSLAAGASLNTTVTVTPEGAVPVSLDSSSVAAIAAAVASSMPTPTAETTGAVPVSLVIDPSISGLLRMGAILIAGSLGWFIGYRAVGGA